jgi:ABC-type dipeptide/oligopeptide/nickel transport system ATPase component
MIKILFNRWRGEPPLISFYADYSYLNIKKWLSKLRLIILGISLFLFFSGILSVTNSMLFTLFLWFLAFLLMFLQSKYVKYLKEWSEKKFIIDRLLLELIVTNHLVDERISTSVCFSYLEYDNEIIVIVFKLGDKFARKVEDLDVEIESALHLPLSKKNIHYDKVEYLFRKFPAEREIIKVLPLESEDMSLKIFDNNSINLRSNFSTIISGVSGSGKSTLLYGLIGQYVSKTIKGKHARLYVHDSKMSDIYKHMLLAEMPERQFGTTVKDAFSMLNELLEELERRKEIYTNSSEFDTVAMDLDLTSDVLEPVLYVIDEYPSLLGLMDSKQRTDWNKKLGNYLRLSRQLSMGAWLVLQQANADETTGISTGLREQLVNKIYTGSEITAQSAQMMFSRGVKELPKVMDKYGGLLSIDSKEPVAFLSPSFAGDINEILQPVLVNASNNYKKFIKKC